MPTIFSAERIRQQEEVRRARKEQLRGLFEVFNHLIVNTGKEQKATALLALITNITGQSLDLSQVRMVQDSQVEPRAVSAAAVARSKVSALLGVLQVEELNEAAVLKAGSDVNGFTFSAQNWTQEHKLARQYDSLSMEQFFILRQQLLQQYCFPESGVVRVRWDMATHLLNGRAHTFNDVVEVSSRPLDPALLDEFLIQAWTNGLILSSNLHFACFEALLAQGQIMGIAHLPVELAREGYQLADFVTTEFGPVLTGAILHSIIANVPVYVE